MAQGGSPRIAHHVTHVPGSGAPEAARAEEGGEDKFTAIVAIVADRSSRWRLQVIAIRGKGPSPTITDLFVRWMLDGTPFPPDGRAALQTIKVLEAAYATMDAR